jgi:protein ImuB
MRALHEPVAPARGRPGVSPPSPSPWDRAPSRPGTVRPTAEPVRTMLLWVPDWPVLAAVADAGLDPAHPLALVEKGLVLACSSAARAEGVRRGQRLRDAQSRSPALQLLQYDPAADHRAFEPVLDRIEAVMPGVQAIRPGLCALRARGPARFYGGEAAAGDELLRAVALPEARLGIAEGPYTAEQAARAAEAGAVLAVPPGGAAAFLAGLPVTALGDEELAALLRRLGVRTLGGFAALDATAVRDRFGEAGARAHALAAGRDPRAVQPRVPPPELEVALAFEPPLDRVDQLAFAARQPAERFIAGLRAAGLACTSLRVVIDDEAGGRSERAWLHPRWFSPADVVDRLRWQLQGAMRGGEQLGAPITAVRLLPEEADELGNHEQGLWGGAPEERVHGALSRVQSLLGHEAVVTAAVGGGRLLDERRVLVPWGEAPVPAPAARAPRRPGTGARPAASVLDAPWPGSLPGPTPATVFAEPPPVQLLDETGEPVRVDERGALSAPPSLFSPAERRVTSDVRAWAGPWPLQQRWWDPERHRVAQRLQLVEADGTAWLLLLEEGRWRAEGRYD